jgi:undecaprenyl diphosphate synthase
MLPKHVAVVLDGNGRWAQKRGMPREAGHVAGVGAVRRIAKYANKIGIKYLTVYAFSTENQKRPEREVNLLMRLFGKQLLKILKNVPKDVKIRFLGDLSWFPEEINNLTEEIMEKTKDNDGMVFSMALNYGGRMEILRAAKKVIEYGIAPENLTEGLFEKFFYTSGIPDVDLFIRSGGEQRISNFLLWQSSYAEFYFTPVFWPDFCEKDLDAALDSFALRSRRFGKIT